tara:strand:- start:745 stop:978 length:234 start_codon:yes stop_codon:yes gene_type:complete
MIKYPWQYKDLNKMPDWVKEQSSIREGIPNIIWMHTLEGEKPAQIGDWVYMDSRGNVHVSKENPKKSLFSRIFKRSK